MNCDFFYFILSRKIFKNLGRQTKMFVRPLKQRFLLLNENLKANFLSSAIFSVQYFIAHSQTLLHGIDKRLFGID
jgi:hypothetical protein